MLALKKILNFRWRCIVGFLLCAGGAQAQTGPDPLTNAADVISLPAERAASALKVSVTGIVTAADPALKGRFWVQDRTGGVFVDNADGPRPEPGDVVEVSGISTVGAYAPVITGPTVKKIGAAPLPPAKQVPIEQLMSGSEDSQRIEVTGIVRAARLDGKRLSLEVMSGGYRFRVYAPILSVVDPQTLVAAEVRVRGTAAEAHNRSLRQLVAAEVYVPSSADFVVEKSEISNPVTQPALPLSSMAQYRRDNSFNQRARVRGTVSLQRIGDSLFLQDSTGGLQVQSRELKAFAPGEEIEAIGFPSFENYLPVLQDAIFRKVDGPKTSLKPRPASLADIRNGLCHANFISISGKVMDRAVRQVRHSARSPMSSRTTLVLQTSNVVYTAEADEPAGVPELASVPLGSVVSVGGVCLTEIDADGKLKTFKMLVASPADVRIVKRPSWLTPQRLLIGLAVLCAVLIVIMSWSIVLSNKNSALKYLIQEREQAQLELEQAHRLLELRVKERTEQLKFQITARKESEVQSKAILAERTRLAQELHDTLEQTLTGIALQMDTTAKLFQKNPTGANYHLEMARNLMSQSQVEVRRSIWDLRCRALEQFDLSGALRLSSRQITNGTEINVEVTARGRVRPLPEIVEDNLLRIGQEALTNVIKHSEATAAKIDLDYGPQKIVLCVEDNGKGFTPDHCIGPHDGHFGLLGISERAKRLSGQVSIISAPGKGATVRVEIALDPSAEGAAASPPRGEIPASELNAAPVEMVDAGWTNETT